MTKKWLHHRCRTARLSGDREGVQKNVIQEVHGYGAVQEYGFYGKSTLSRVTYLCVELSCLAPADYSLPLSLPSRER